MAAVEIRLMDQTLVEIREQDPVREGERIQAQGGTTYAACYVTWTPDGGQRVHVYPVRRKGSVVVEPGFSERDDMPVDKGREGS